LIRLNSSTYTFKKPASGVRILKSVRLKTMDNLTVNGTLSKSEDFFHVLTDNNFEKWVGLAFLLPVVLSGIPALCGIIWFEKNKCERRTLLNRLVSYNCWVGVVYLASKMTDVYRSIVGPLPAWVCCIHVVLLTSIVWMFLLGLDAIALTRYLFIFWLKNPMAFSDDFWIAFIRVWITAVSVFTLGTWHAIADFNVIGFYSCSGHDFTIARQFFPKDYGVVEKLSVLLHLFIYLRIYFYKKTLKTSNVDNIRLGKDSLYNIGFNFSTVLIIASLVITLKNIEKTPTEMLIQYPHYLQIYYIMFVIPSIFILTLLLSFYRNKELRKSVLEHFKSIF